MPDPYGSIYETLPVITKKEMCALLNLDLARPNLFFSQAEIIRAYRIRARQFHPDRQYLAPRAIPEAICNLLMADLVRSRDHLLKGEDNIRGKSSPDNEIADWLTYVLATLNGIKDGSSDIVQTLTWMSRLSRSIFIIAALSTYSDGQLNLRYVNEFSPVFDVIRPLLYHVESIPIVTLLKRIQRFVHDAASEEQNIFIGLRELVSAEMITDAQLQQLSAAINGAREALHVELTDNLIGHVEHILKFWPHFIARLPSWGHLTAVLLITLLGTATSLPKYANALRVLTEVILQQKGSSALVIASPVLLLLAICLLPLNSLIQCTTQLFWLGAKAALTFLNNALALAAKLMLLPYNLLFAEASNAELIFSLFNNVVNLSVRLLVTSMLETLDSTLFYLTDLSLLSSWVEGFNDYLDRLLVLLKPLSANPAEHGQQVILVNHYEQASKVRESDAAPILPFFSSSPLHNQEDNFLNTLLAQVAQFDGSDNHLRHEPV